MNDIANGLLAKYRDVETNPRVFSIHEVLDELIGELQASPLGSGTEFRKHYSSGALYVSGDKTGMARALGNIIKNALEAMESNSGNKAKQLIVSTSLELPPHPGPLPEGEGVRICITDTGPGISADKIPLILQGGHTEGKNGGHGIGTKVVKDVVVAHKGGLSIESEVGKGSTFIISLPVTQPIDNAETGMTVTIPYSGVGPICVIDDESSMREQWRLTLKGLGVEAEVFTCWEDFVSRHPRSESTIDSGDPVMNDNAGFPLSLNPNAGMTLCRGDSVFIVDYHFDNSEVDGVEVIRRLKERGYTNFVLATAEYWKPAIKEAASKLNITLCPKPLPKVVVQSPSPSQSSPPQSGSFCSGGPGLIVTTGSPLPISPAGIQCGDDSGAPTILLIDDDPDIHMCWKMMRKALGVGKMTAHKNIEEMIATATNPAKFDLCVIDKNIEGSQFDGARTLEYLRQNGARIIVLASGDGEDDIRKDPRFNSADGILKSKVPMTPEELDPFLN